MPVTISRPRTPRISSTAATKALPSPSWIAADSALTPEASASSVRTADAISLRAVSLCGAAAVRGVGLAMNGCALRGLRRGE